ncbi:unnamed protein product [Ostreobium quekettii]|uniref:N(6)-adenine-specific DNA methyltransferase 2 n=1 Tax=Ostreobium quekettii TaxID=121088 RepID=A0A8S1JFK6_9CHLO|nr:unnamed protein product [Ostreobium quekettii]
MDAADDEVPALSGSTLLALGDFLNGQLEDALTDADPFAEDWGLSQFWYTEETAMAVAEEVANIVGTDGRVACISCPSLFRSLLQSFPEVQCHLLEYDTRFEVFGNFVHYDYNKPLALPDELKGAFDVVLADPPYLVSGSNAELSGSFHIERGETM